MIRAKLDVLMLCICYCDRILIGVEIVNVSGYACILAFCNSSFLEIGA